MEQDELRKVLETLLFITDRPLSVGNLCQLSGVKDAELVGGILAQIKSGYQEKHGGIQVLETAGGFQMGTMPEYSQWVRKLFHDKMVARLSAAGLETLAIIAYKQPITRAEIEALRGVEVIASLETLLERRLIKVVGRKETVGRPLLYGTSMEFLRQFGLRSLEELPRLESLISSPAAFPGEIQPESPQAAAPAAEPVQAEASGDVVSPEELSPGEPASTAPELQPAGTETAEPAAAEDGAERENPVSEESGENR